MSPWIGEQFVSTTEQNFNRVLVIGAGTMGSGIAQVIAQAGIPATMIDQTTALVGRGQETIERNWARAIEKGRLTPDAANAARLNLHTGTAIDDGLDSDLVIEAVSENPGIKIPLFHDLGDRFGPQVVLASNTSSISISQLAASAAHPERVLGLHFFNPVPVLSLVEMVRGLQTSDATVQRGEAFVRQIDKTPVAVKDSPGFVSNRVLMPMINEAVFCLSDGVAPAAAIDEIMKLGMAHPMGPLALADLIGLDICLHILEVLHRDLGEDKYRPAPLLRRMVAAGKLGRKNGEGFFRYA